MRDIQTPINNAVDMLDKSVNDMSVNYLHIKKAFLRLHPYLLQQVAKGVCSAVKRRETDGRISIETLKYILREE